MSADGNIFVGDMGVPATIPLAGEEPGLADQPVGAVRPGRQPAPAAADRGREPAADRRDGGRGPPGPGRRARDPVRAGRGTGQLYAVPAPYLDQTATLVTTLTVGASTFAPVAMAVDTNGDLLVLDRGDGPGTAEPAEDRHRPAAAADRDPDAAAAR